jgi:hypothetical protein
MMSFLINGGSQGGVYWANNIQRLSWSNLFESFMTGAMVRLTVAQLIVEGDNTILTPLLKQDMGFRG